MDWHGNLEEHNEEEPKKIVHSKNLLLVDYYAELWIHRSVKSLRGVTTHHRAFEEGTGGGER